MKKTNFKIKINSVAIATIFAVFFSIGITSCKQNTQNENTAITQTETKIVITEQEVLEAQKAWGEGIVKIGKVYLEKGDYKTAAIEHINNFYNYQEGVVLLNRHWFPKSNSVLTFKVLCHTLLVEMKIIPRTMDLQ